MAMAVVTICGLDYRGHPEGSGRRLLSKFVQQRDVDKFEV